MLKEMDIQEGIYLLPLKFQIKEFIETDEPLKRLSIVLNSIGSYIDLFNPSSMDDLEDILRVWRHLEAHYKR